MIVSGRRDGLVAIPVDEPKRVESAGWTDKGLKKLIAPAPKDGVAAMDEKRDQISLDASRLSYRCAKKFGHYHQILCSPTEFLHSTRLTGRNLFLTGKNFLIAGGSHRSRMTTAAATIFNPFPLRREHSWIALSGTLPSICVDLRCPLAGNS